MLPIAVFLSIWSYEISILQICIEFGIATVFTIYICILASMSPCLPLMNSWVGPFLTIISWIFSQSMLMRIRCVIATRLDRFGHKVLLILSAMTKLGQLFGGIIIFVIINCYNLLKEKPECADNFCPF